MIKKTVCLLLLVLASLTCVMAQDMTRSPYSRFGYGLLQQQSMGMFRAMGGLGYGVRSNRAINSMNPASYTAIDSLTFMLDFGVSGTGHFFKTASNRNEQFSGTLDYLSFQLPICRWMAVSFGLQPYTSVGYSYSESSVKHNYSSVDTVIVTQSYQGDGGFSQVYLGFGFNILNRVSVGVNGRYMFGRTRYYRQVDFDKLLYTSSVQTTTLQVSSFLADLGLQYIQPIGNDCLVVGGTYSFKLPMGMTSQISTTTNQTFEDNTAYKFDYPQSFGVGASYNYNNKWLVGLDYGRQYFGEANYYGQTDSLRNRNQWALGVEFAPAERSKKYYQLMRYRLGASFSNSYAPVNNKHYNEFSVSLGLGFPLTNARTMINFQLEYGHRAWISQTGLEEQYLRIALDIALNERWFVKRKFN